MANINLTYWGLTGIKGSVTVDEAALVDALITAIAADEGLDTNYYVISKLNDPSKSSFYYSDSSTTINTISITNGTVILCTPNQNGTKEARQLQKLEIAEVKRKAGGDTSKVYYRTLNSYDINLLPNPYNGNVPEPDDGASTLTDGRPWTLASLVTTNLTLHLDPNDSNSYSGSGTTYIDLAGGDNDITLVGSPTYTSGTPSYFTFNGTNQYGTGAGTGVCPSTAYTKFFYFYLNGYLDNNFVSSATGGHFMFMGASTNRIYCGHANWSSLGGTYLDYPSTATFNLNTWYCACLTFSTTNGMTLYVNGVQDSTFTTRKNAHGGNGSTNIATFGGGNFLNGRLGEILCYSSELSAAQVLQNFNATKATYGL